MSFRIFAQKIGYAICTTISILALGCNDNRGVYEEPIEIEVEQDSTSVKQEIVLYQKFFLEPPLEEGFQFGMLLSEWNKQLAILAKNGVIDWLNDNADGYYFGRVEFSTYYDNSRKEGYGLTGIFKEAKNWNDTVEVLSRNNIKVKEPILIGIQYNYLIKPHNVVSQIEAIIRQNNLSYIAGYYPVNVNPKPITTSEFPYSLKDAAIALRGGREKEAMCNKVTDLTFSRVSTALFENEQYYSVFTWEEKTSATVQKDNDCRVSYVYSGKRELSFQNTIYSKKQADLKVEDYLTNSQRDEIETRQRTQNLIDKALE
jgi:hypothetical protein